MVQVMRLVERSTAQKVRLIGAASTARHNLLKQKPYEYDAPVDYRDESWPEQVRAATGGSGVEIVMECISEEEMVYRTANKFTRDGDDPPHFETPRSADMILTRCALSPYIERRGSALV